jgi:pSer/pThr/pTyr-binding forkhead associated (FHA) protein
MNGVARGLLGRARALESRISRTVDRAAQRIAKSGGREPLEIAHAVVDVVEEQVQPSGRGRHVFPFNLITVRVVAATRDARARYAAVFDGASPLCERIAQRLEAAGCHVEDLAVTVTYALRAKAAWLAPDFHVTFDRITPAPLQILAVPPASALARMALELAIVRGAAEPPTYTFVQARVDLGRCVEVRDGRHRLLRTNHVAFLDTADPINQSVSRQHAHISATGHDAYRLCDDGSSQGTGVLREGRTVPVPPGARGVRLVSGDEIVLGGARVRVRLLRVKSS